MTQYEAVAAACRELGVRTSIKVLVRRASQLYGSPVGYNSTCTYRKTFCVAEGFTKPDCRSYKGQPRRNMLDDSQVSWQGIKLIRDLCNKLHVSGKGLAEKLQSFHSLDQLVLHCKEYDFIKVVA